MFPVGPRRPMPPYPPMPPQRMQGPPRGPFQGPPRGPSRGPQKPGLSNLLAMFQTPEGSWDFERVSTTVKQMNEIYGQVSPMISKFIKR